VGSFIFLQHAVQQKAKLCSYKVSFGEKNTAIDMKWVWV